MSAVGCIDIKTKFHVLKAFRLDVGRGYDIWDASAGLVQDLNPLRHTSRECACLKPRNLCLLQRGMLVRSLSVWETECESREGIANNDLGGKRIKQPDYPLPLLLFFLIVPRSGQRGYADPGRTVNVDAVAQLQLLRHGIPVKHAWVRYRS